MDYAEPVAPPTTPLLPQELLELITDYHRDDFEVLRILSVVSSSFLFPTRRHLFHTMALLDPQGSYTSFLLLIKEGPTICQSIRDLTVGPRGRHSSLLHQQPFSMSQIGEIIQLLPHLRRFIVRNLMLHSESSPTVLPASRQLEKLNISWCYFPGGTWMVVFQLIGYFHSIAHLELCGLRGENVEDCVSWGRRDLPSLLAERQTVLATLKKRMAITTRLTFIDNIIDIADLLNGILAVVDAAQLESLDIGHAVHIRELYTLLIRGVASPYLKHLIVRVNEDQHGTGDTPATDSNQRTIDLSLCTSLQSTELRFAIYTIAKDFQSDVFDTLATLPSNPLLSTITIRITPMRYLHDHPIFNALLRGIAWHEGWRKLARLLSRLPELVSVTVVFVKEDSSWSIPATVTGPIQATLSGRYEVAFEHTCNMTDGEARLR